nr:hypothetical protein CFP56_64419 [Quercus suber]
MHVPQPGSSYSSQTNPGIQELKPMELRKVRKVPPEIFDGVEGGDLAERGARSDLVVPDRTLWCQIGPTTISTSKNPLLSFAPSLISLLTFFTFHLSQLLFSASLSLVSSPYPHSPAYPFELFLGLVRFFLVSDSSASVSPDFRTRAKVSLSFVLFVAACAASGFVGLVSVF